MKRKLKLFLPLVLICSLFIGSTCFAKPLVPSFQELLDKVLVEYVGIVLPPSAFQNFEEWYHQNVAPSASGRGFDDYLADNITIGEDDSTVSPELQNYYYQFALDYIDEHPTSYSIQNIYPTDMASSTLFASQTQYDAFVSTAHSLASNGNFVFSNLNFNGGIVSYIYLNGSITTTSAYGNNYKLLFYYPSTNDLDFYMSNGHVNNYGYYSSFVPTANWSAVPLINLSGKQSSAPLYTWLNGWKCKIILNNGFVSDCPGMAAPGTLVNYLRNYSNTNGLINSANFGIFNTTDRIMRIFAYDSIDAIKLHDTGQPSPYYLTDNYVGEGFIADGDVTISNANAVNNSQIYEEITQTVTTGITADELVEIIKTIVDTNNDKPLPDDGSSDDDDDDLSFLDKLFESIGKLVKKIIEGIAGVITDAVNALQTVVDEIFRTITNLISWFTSEDSGIFQFLKFFLEWLPEPIPTLLITFFTMSVIFAVIKLVKGALS